MPQSTTGKVASLLKDMPNLFSLASTPHELSEDYIFVPIDKVEDAQREDARLPAGLVDAEQTDERDEITSESLEDAIAENLDGFPLDVAPLDNLANALPGIGAGGPVARSRFPGMPPPPDSLAFYLPFHFFAPTWWGVYLTVEGVGLVARDFMMLSGGRLRPKDAVTAAKLFLYYHEAYHHRVECFATRLELSHRKPLYVRGFQSHFSRVFGTDRCIEEGLANADAYLKTLRKVPLKPLGVAIRKAIRKSPPGYRLGVKLSKEFKAMQARLAEVNFRESLPTHPRSKDRIWQSMGHLFDGLSNIRGRVNYILHRHSPLLARSRMRPLLPPTKLIKKLDAAVSMVFVRHGANHDIYRTGRGNTVPIPRHPRDLNRGLLRKILKEAGIEIGLSEFLAN
jgi:predicted RNA binding protein YcfA (HicA-like mRNA interferase family)